MKHYTVIWSTVVYAESVEDAVLQVVGEMELRQTWG